MKVSCKKFKQTCSVEVTIKLRGIEEEAAKCLGIYFNFSIPASDKWGISIIDEKYATFSRKGKKHIRMGKFEDGLWKGIIYPNTSPNKSLFDKAIKELKREADKALKPILWKYKKLYKK